MGSTRRTKDISLIIQSIRIIQRFSKSQKEGREPKPLFWRPLSNSSWHPSRVVARFLGRVIRTQNRQRKKRRLYRQDARRRLVTLRSMDPGFPSTSRRTRNISLPIGEPGGGEISCSRQASMLARTIKKRNCSIRSHQFKKRQMNWQKHNSWMHSPHYRDSTKETWIQYKRPVGSIMWLRSRSRPKLDLFACMVKPMELFTVRSIRSSWLAIIIWNCCRSVRRVWWGRGRRRPWSSDSKAEESRAHTVLHKAWMTSRRVKHHSRYQRRQNRKSQSGLHTKENLEWACRSITTSTRIWSKRWRPGNCSGTWTTTGPLKIIEQQAPCTLPSHSSHQERNWCQHSPITSMRSTCPSWRIMTSRTNGSTSQITCLESPQEPTPPKGSRS